MSLISISKVFLFVAFALLVGNGAGGLAGRLAGSLALATTTLGSSFFQVGFIQSFDVFHVDPPNIFSPIQYSISVMEIQGIQRTLRRLFTPKTPPIMALEAQATYL